MCGITGFYGYRIEVPFDWKDILISMANRIAHRGPDSEGIWYDVESGIGMAHRRLSILDLTLEGYQPMISNTGRYVIVYNGEIYNYCKIMEDLIKLGYRFRGHSDTEVMLAAFEQWGVEKAIQRFNGMFAFALWDKEMRQLYLVRDRIGEKPLYYGIFGSIFAFGSELKTFKAHPLWNGDIDNNALGMFMKYGYIPAPYTIYKNIQKLRPGTILTIYISQSGIDIKEQQYWSTYDVVKNGIDNPINASEEEMVIGLEQLLLDSIRQQMISDVPLGAFLSGGIDSSTVVALMQGLSNQPIKTYSIGFEYDEFNEAHYAKKVAQYLGTQHTEYLVGSKEALDIIPNLPNIFDEPFADTSQIPTFLVSQLASQQVTVCLSGDGGDELFCGYSRYFLVNNIWTRISCLPFVIRRKIADLILRAPLDQLDCYFGWLSPLFRKYGNTGKAGDKLKKAAILLKAQNPEEFYSLLITNWNDTQKLFLVPNHKSKPAFEKNNYFSKDIISQMMHFDTVSYLPDDILVKLDRATMANSLESRIPYLDYRIVEYTWRLPMSVKYKNKKGKWILREVLNKYIPKEIFDRPKMGFSVPMQEWLIGPLRDWAEEYLKEKRLRDVGYLDPIIIREKWLEHVQGKRNWQNQIWSILVFQAWYANQ